jgi:hypothetical protein
MKFKSFKLNIKIIIKFNIVDDQSSEDHKIQFESQTSKIGCNSSQNHQSHIIQDLTLLNQSQLSLRKSFNFLNCFLYLEIFN